MNSWNHPKWGEDGNSSSQQQSYPFHQFSSSGQTGSQSVPQSSSAVGSSSTAQGGQTSLQSQTSQSSQQPRHLQASSQVPIHSYPYNYSTGEYQATHPYHDEYQQGQQTQPQLGQVSPQNQPATGYLQQVPTHLDQDQYNIWTQQQQQQHLHHQSLQQGSQVRHHLSTFIYPPSDMKLESDELISSRLNQSGSISTSSTSSTSSLSGKKRRSSSKKDVATDSMGLPIAKVATKRSRMGCLTCRQRKKRCCETKPKCTECCRLGLNCVWPKPGTEHKNKQKDAKLEENTIDHEIYGKIKVLRGIVEYKSK